MFSLLYYGIMVAHGDFVQADDKDWKPCLQNINSFVSVFLFSLETQHTIGFGVRYPTEECPEIVFTLGLQSMVGVIIQTLMVGVVFAKLTRPKKRAETLLFSRNATINLRNGKLCLCFRIGDIRKCKLANVQIHMLMINKYTTEEGEVLPFFLNDMKVQIDTVKDFPTLAWPVIACHFIDENSPLYRYDETGLQNAKLEIIVILDGLIPTTGMTTQARTSYLPFEILWGRRFHHLMTYQKKNGIIELDYTKFNSTYAVRTPRCSAEKLKQNHEVSSKMYSNIT
ncbi:unnamed protein product [Soboliphyme baturini]|uniref:Inward rectifier potassium channel irk-1 n=1 Tax=Soboliphyme baturini TaxID=241478 RepID=A0A183IGD3_9BILA|nr:unnamed protein product [Soboliphyme baturini]